MSQTTIDAGQTVERGRGSIFRSLYFQVLVAIALGALLGAVSPATGAAMQPLGDGFIKLIKMIIAPVIFVTVVLGIAGTEDLKRVGKIGGLALLYFEVVTTLALVLGLVIVNVLQPGAGMNVDVKTLDSSRVAGSVTAGKAMDAKDFILNLIPTTFIDAFAKGEILQVLLLAVLFGIALQFLDGRENRVYQFFEDLSRILFAVVGLIMKLAPVGAFGAMAFTVGNYGLASLLSLAKLMGTFYVTCLAFVFLVLGTISWAHGFSVWRLLVHIREELLIVLATSSSEPALPRLMKKLENLGASKSTVGLVIPAGYSFNLDGTAIYLTMAAMFVAQATNTPMTLGHQLTLLAVLLLTSKGAAGVTGSGFIVLAATLSATGQIPVAGVALILGVDRFMSEARALTNVTGNAVATLVVAKWTGDLDMRALDAGLKGSGRP
ncbi:MAG: dicarboxylate/amino acid:cation symporter [Acidobacteriota bacterium]